MFALVFWDAYVHAHIYIFIYIDYYTVLRLTIWSASKHFKEEITPPLLATSSKSQSLKTPIGFVVVVFLLPKMGHISWTISSYCYYIVDTHSWSPFFAIGECQGPWDRMTSEWQWWLLFFLFAGHITPLWDVADYNLFGSNLMAKYQNSEYLGVCVNWCVVGLQSLDWIINKYFCRWNARHKHA